MPNIPATQGQAQPSITTNTGTGGIGTFMSDISPPSLTLPGSQLEGGASEDEFEDADFGVAPLANIAPQQQAAIPAIQSGGAVNSQAPNPELKVINISGNDKD